MINAIMEHALVAQKVEERLSLNMGEPRLPEQSNL